MKKIGKSELITLRIKKVRAIRKLKMYTEKSDPRSPSALDQISMNYQFCSNVGVGTRLTRRARTRLFTQKWMFQLEAKDSQKYERITLKNKKNGVF